MILPSTAHLMKCTSSPNCLLPYLFILNFLTSNLLVYIVILLVIYLLVYIILHYLTLSYSLFYMSLVLTLHSKFCMFYYVRLEIKFILSFY